MFTKSDKYDPDYVTHRKFAKENQLFKKCCKEAGVERTVRQASKFRRGMGSAYKAAIKAKQVK